MKRAITGIVAASLTLGTMAPAAFAATTSAPSYFGSKIAVGTYSSNVQALKVMDAGTPTALFPFYYIQSGLNSIGYQVSWDGVAKKLSITTPAGVTLDPSKVGDPGVGDVGIYINGTLVQRAPFQVANDKGGNNKPTSFMSAYYLNKALGLIGFTNTYDGTGAGWGLTAPTPAPAKFGVQSVQAVNAEEIDVTFTQPVDTTQSFANALVAATAGAALPGTLSYDTSADGKTLMIYTSNPMTQGGYYTVNLSGILDAATRTVQAPYSTTVQLNDKTAPSISAITAKTAQTTATSFTVSFSEPVLMDSVKVGDVFASATSSDGGWDYTVALPGGADPLQAGQSYAVTIAGLRDLVGNYAANPLTTSVTVVQDTTKPTFTLQAVSPSEIYVKFSKTMNTTSIPVDAITVKDSLGNVLPLAGLPSFKSDKTTLDVKLAGSAIPSGYSSASVNVEVKSLQDSLGNVVADTKNDLTLTKSTTKPAISSVRVIDATHLEVTFNEAGLSFGSAASTFEITDSTKAVAATVNAVSAEDSSNRAILTLDAPGLNYTDTFTLAMVVGTVSDASGNTNDAGTAAFNFTGAAPATVTAQVYGTNGDGGAASDSSTNRAVTVLFNQPDVVSGISASTGNYKTGAADNVANYTLDGAALPSGTHITTGVDAVTHNVYAVIDFSATGTSMPSEFANGGTGALTVSGIKTVSGGSLAYTSQSFTVADSTKPTISTAYVSGTATSGYTVTLVMSEKVNTAAAGDFQLKAGSQVINPDAVALSGTDATRVTLTVGTGNANIAAFKSNLAAITVALTGSGTLADLHSNAAVAGTPVSVIDYATN